MGREFIAVLTAFFVAQSCSQNFVRIPLKKFLDSSGTRILHDAIGSGELRKNRTAAVGHGLPPTLSEKYADVKYLQYYGVVEVGTPPQRFEVSFNPGQSLTTIPSTKLRKKCGAGVRAFDPISSHSFRDIQESVVLDGGKTRANITKDIFHVGQNKVLDQYFGHVQDGKCHKELFYDGTIGLGLSNNYLTLLDNMVTQQIVNISVAGLYLDRDVKTTRGGEVALGYWNPKLVENPKPSQYIPIVDSVNPEWQIRLQLALIGNHQVTFDRLALLDTKSYYIDIPDFEAEIIAKEIGAINYKGNLIVDCERVGTLPNLTINIQGIDYILEGKDYVDQANSYRSQCVVFIRASDSNVWTLGGVFLGKYYTIFNYETQQVAFAKLIPPNRGNSSFKPMCWCILMLIALIQILNN